MPKKCTEKIMVFHQNGYVDIDEWEQGEAEDFYSERYCTMDRIEQPATPELAEAFFNCVEKGVEIAGPTVAHGAMILATGQILAYGTDGFLGVICACMGTHGIAYLK